MTRYRDHLRFMDRFFAAHWDHIKFMNFAAYWDHRRFMDCFCRYWDYLKFMDFFATYWDHILWTVFAMYWDHLQFKNCASFWGKLRFAYCSFPCIGITEDLWTVFAVYWDYLRFIDCSLQCFGITYYEPFCSVLVLPKIYELFLQCIGITEDLWTVFAVYWYCLRFMNCFCRLLGSPMNCFCSVLGSVLILCSILGSTKI